MEHLAEVLVDDELHPSKQRLIAAREARMKDLMASRSVFENPSDAS